MKRYDGESLPGESPHIVVLGSCKVGNFVVTTPVLQGLKARFPRATLGFIGSEVTAAYEAAHPAIDWRLSWDDPTPGAGLSLQQQLADRLSRHGPVALAINLDGFNPVTCTLTPWLQPLYVAGGALVPNLRRKLAWGDEPEQRFLADPDWDSLDFKDRYRDSFNSNYIAELFCRLAYVADFVDPTAIQLPQEPPTFSVPELLIHCTTARAAKIWPFRYWRAVIEDAVRHGLEVGLVGGPPSTQKEAYNAGDGEEWLLSTTPLRDLRGQTNLLQLAGACAQAKAVISVDAGPLHIAAAVGTPTLAVVGNDDQGIGASPIRLWLPRVKNLSRTCSLTTCTLCSDNRFRNDDCLVDGHPCMSGVSVESVLRWLHQQILTPDPSA